MIGFCVIGWTGVALLLGIRQVLAVKLTLLHATVALLLSSAELRPDWQLASWVVILSACLQRVKLAAHSSVQRAAIGLVSNHACRL